MFFILIRCKSNTYKISNSLLNKFLSLVSVFACYFIYKQLAVSNLCFKTHLSIMCSPFLRYLKMMKHALVELHRFTFFVFRTFLSLKVVAEKIIYTFSKFNFSIPNIKSIFAHATQRTYFRFRIAIYTAYCA